MIAVEGTGWAAAVIGEEDGRSASSFVVVETEGDPRDRSAVVVLCQGVGPRAASSSEFAVGEICALLEQNQCMLSFNPRVTSAALEGVDARMRDRDGSAVLCMALATSTSFSVFVVGTARAFLLAPGRADELTGDRSLEQRMRTLGVRAGSTPFGVDAIVALRQFEHSFLLVSTERVLGAIERGGCSMANLVRPDDVPVGLRDRIGAYLEGIDAAAVLLALRARPS